MFKKIIAVVTLPAFLVFSVSCFHVRRTVRMTYDESRIGELVHAEIAAVQTKEGETLDFP